MDTMVETTRPLLADTPLGRTVSTTATDIWNDSCAVDELEYAISYGAVGATANPTIVSDVWKADPAHWRDRVRALAAERPDTTEVDLAWAVVEEMSLRAAPLLRPAFDASGGRQGRLSMQTDPTLFRASDRMLAQGEHFASLAPNIIVKFPATSVGVRVMEEATYAGSASTRRCPPASPRHWPPAKPSSAGYAARGRGPASSTTWPVITLMMARLEDWLRCTERDGIIVDLGALPWSGVAVFKRAVAEFQARGLAREAAGAAIRHHLHWSELIGGDVVITLPAVWQRRFDASSVEVRRGWTTPSIAAILDELQARSPGLRSRVRTRSV